MLEGETFELSRFPGNRGHAAGTRPEIEDERAEWFLEAERHRQYRQPATRVRHDDHASELFWLDAVPSDVKATLQEHPVLGPPTLSEESPAAFVQIRDLTVNLRCAHAAATYLWTPGQKIRTTP